MYIFTYTYKDMVDYLSIYIIKMCRGKDICLVKMANMSKDLNSAGRLSWLAHFHLLGLITWCCSLNGWVPGAWEPHGGVQRLVKRLF